MIFIILFLIFFAPIYYIIKIELKEITNHYFEKTLPFILLFDFLINLNTAYYEKGKLIKIRKNIFSNQIHNYFISNIISIIPYLFLNKINTYHENTLARLTLITILPKI
jgi:hypothetical protein